MNGSGGIDGPCGGEPGVRAITARGEGGIHLFRVSGEAACARLGSVFDRPLPERGRLAFGLLRSAGGPVDEVLVAGLGRREFEVSCHGGEATRIAVGRLLLGEEGGRARPPEPAAANSIEQEAYRCLLRTAAPMAADFFLHAVAGSLDREVADLLRAVRAGLPVPGILEGLDGLLAGAPAGLALAEGAGLVLLGAPNAGKSTLGNRLAGESRFIATAEAGTTRDLVETGCTIGGFPFRLLDTAGLREAVDPVEAEGVGRALAAAGRRGTALLVVDGSEAEPPIALLAGVARGPGALCALAKSDAGLRIDPARLEEQLGVPVVPVSAREGTGIRRLAAHILFRSPFARSVPLQVPRPFTRRQEAGLGEARDALLAGDRRGAVAALERVRCGPGADMGDNRGHEAGLHHDR